MPVRSVLDGVQREVRREGPPHGFGCHAEPAVEHRAIEGEQQERSARLGESRCVRRVAGAPAGIQTVKATHVEDEVERLA